MTASIKHCPLDWIRADYTKPFLFLLCTNQYQAETNRAATVIFDKLLTDYSTLESKPTDFNWHPNNLFLTSVWGSLSQQTSQCHYTCLSSVESGALWMLLQICPQWRMRPSWCHYISLLNGEWGSLDVITNLSSKECEALWMLLVHISPQWSVRLSGSCRTVALRKNFCWQTGELQCHP